MKKSKFRISYVEFEANIPVDGSYKHAHIRAGAEVPSGESPQDTLDKVKDFVAGELRRAKGEVKTVVTPGKFQV